MLNEVMKYFKEYSQETIINTLFEMNKYYDKDLKLYFKTLKNNTGKTMDSFQRKMLRNYYYKNPEILKK